MAELIEVPQETKPINESVAYFIKRRALGLRLADAITQDDRSEIDAEIGAGRFADADDYVALFDVVWLLGKENRQLLGFEPSLISWEDQLKKSLVDAELVDIAKQKIMAFYEDKMDCAYHLAMLSSLLSDLFDLRSEAEALFNKALSIDAEPLKSVIVMRMYSAALDDWGRHSEAEVVILKALEISPDNALSHWRLARTLWLQCCFNEAKVSYLKVIELVDGHDNFLSAYAWLNIAIISKKQEQYNAAKEACLKSIDLDSGIARAWSGLAYSLNIEGDHAGAEAGYRKALAISDGRDYENWISLATLLNHSLHNYPEAIIAYQRALELQPGDIVTAIEIKNLTILVSLQKEIESMPNSIQSTPSLAYSLYCAERFQESEVVYRKAIELNPLNVALLIDFGQLLNRMERHTDAENVFRKAIEIEPDNKLALFKLAAPLHDQGKHKESEAIYRQLIDADVYRSASLALLPSVLIALHKYDEAAAIYSVLSEEFEGLPISIFYKNSRLSLLCSHSNSEAGAIYSKTLELEQDNARAIHNSGRLLYANGRCAEAEVLYRKALELEPNNPDIWISLAQLLRAGENHTEATLAYQKARNLAFFELHGIEFSGCADA